MTITINIQKQISGTTLENIFVTALEGGSNHWYFINDDTIKKVREAVPREVENCISVAIFKAVFEKQLSVPVCDIDTMEELGTLNPFDAAQKLQALANDDDYRWALEKELDDNGDAISSDVVFQHLVMGEVLYA